MEIDIKKLLPPITDNHCNTIDFLNKANQEILEALHIMQSTIQYFDDGMCLEFNKERMIKYLNKYKQD